MKKCKNCGKENEDDLHFCLECGEPLPKSKNIFKKIIILVAILLIIGIIVGVLSYTDILNNDSTNQSNGFEENLTVNESIQSNKSLEDSSNINDEKKSSTSSSNRKSSVSTQSLDFDGLFQMDVDKDVDFEESFTTNNGIPFSEKHWVHMGDVGKGESIINVYYWLKDKNYDFDLDDYDGPEKDGDLIILTNKNKEEGFPQNYDYLVLVSNGDEIVGIMSDDLSLIKDYANSVKF